MGLCFAGIFDQKTAMHGLWLAYQVCIQAFLDRLCQAASIVLLNLSNHQTMTR
jgi:hypothetical protein